MVLSLLASFWAMAKWVKTFRIPWFLGGLAPCRLTRINWMSTPGSMSLPEPHASVEI